MNNPDRADSRARRRQVQALVGRNQIGTQEQLLALLEAEGVAATQATVSRDLRELGIRKQAGRYSLPPGPSATSGRRRQLSRNHREKVIGAGRTGSLVVIRTKPGQAASIATALNDAQLPEILGALAGADVVFVATQTGSEARQILALFAR